MIFIVIPVFNRIALTVACLQSLREQTVSDFKVIVVDDGSTDQTYETISKDFPEVLLLRGDGNLWWAGATNVGVRKALELSTDQNDYVLTLNNDLVVKQDYLSQLLAVRALDPKFIVGSYSVSDTSEDLVEFSGMNWNRKTGKYTYPQRMVPRDELKGMKYLHSQILPGRGVLFPIRVFREVGLYDEKNFPQYMADDDFSLRCTFKGYRLVVATNAIVYTNVQATGLTGAYTKLSFLKFVESLGSIRSSNNLKIRYRWARKHAAYPFLYFCLDSGRVLFSFFKKSK